MIYSTGVTYALRALVYIATRGHDRWVSTREISEQQGLPAPFLGKLLQMLGRAGITSSSRGPGGGHVLARDPDEISLLDLVTCIDGPLDWDASAIAPAPANGRAATPLHARWQALQADIYAYLTQSTVSMFCAAAGAYGGDGAAVPCGYPAFRGSEDAVPPLGPGAPWEANR